MTSTQHRIVRRAFSQYTTVEVFTGTFVDASNRADAMQFANQDGEYFLRGVNEPDRRESSSYQSGFDWL